MERVPLEVRRNARTSAQCSQLDFSLPSRLPSLRSNYSTPTALAPHVLVVRRGLAGYSIIQCMLVEINTTTRCWFL